MPKAKNGDTVKVHYTGTLSDGTVFDSSLKRDTLQFKIGERKLIPGFEDAVVELEVGKKTTVTIPSDKAYGPSKKELVLVVEREKIPDHVKPQIGQVLQFQKQDDAGKPTGEVVAFNVKGVTDTHLTLDANHPLAGKDLTFEIELVEIL